jgi:putative NADH-flavin reductase
LVHSDIVRRILLVLTALIFIVIGVRAVFAPEQMAAGLGYVLTGSNGYSEFYAVYLGVWLATAALAILAAVRIRLSLIGDLVAMFVLAQPVGRLFALTRFGLPEGVLLAMFALEEGHEVTALLRNPAKLKIDDSRLKIVKGDILDAASATAAIAGQDAVCVCIGIPPTRKPVTVFSRGIERVLAAMDRRLHQKLIAVTGIGAGDSKGHGGFFYDRVTNPLFLGTIYADKDRQEAIIKASDVEWLIVRPGFLTSGPRTGKYRAIENLSGVIAGKISRADVADFMLKQLATPSYFGRTPLLTY